MDLLKGISIYCSKLIKLCKLLIEVPGKCLETNILVTGNLCGWYSGYILAYCHK